MWGRFTASTTATITATLNPSHSLPLTLSTNRLARLSPSSVLLTSSETTLLATLTHDLTKTSTPTFLPLTVDFRTKAASLGIIPNTWSRRELQPTQPEILTSRLIDRSLRAAIAPSKSLFPPSQLCVSVLSAARHSKAPFTNVLAVNAGAACLAASDLNLPLVAASTVSASSQGFTAFPTDSNLQHAEFSLFVAINDQQNILAMTLDTPMIPIPESRLMDALEHAIKAANPLIDLQKEFRERVHEVRERDGHTSFPRRMPTPASQPAPVPVSESVRDEIRRKAEEVFQETFVKCRTYPGKAHRAQVMTHAQQSIVDAFPEIEMNIVLEEAGKAAKKAFRNVLVKDNLRVDGRGFDDLRSVRCESGFLPGDVHGSALFERGDTQVLACSTIGLKKEAMRTQIYADGGKGPKSFFVHYSFPPLATGESGRFGGAQSRREIGHGALAENAIRPVLDLKKMYSGGNQGQNDDDAYPYAIRLSAEVLGSDGSSSMATVCAGSLALVQAGVPVKEHVAGVAMGLISADSNSDEDDIVLTDILGSEDHFGDMDMKVAGTETGVTACQLDTKKKNGVGIEIFTETLKKAKDARVKILKIMNDELSEKTSEIPDNAPQVIVVPVNTPVAIKTLMRDRAEGLREIEERSESNLEFDGKQGTITIEAPNKQSAETARQLITAALGNLAIGTTMVAKVIDVKPSYAILEGSAGIAQGLLHVSKMYANPELLGKKPLTENMNKENVKNEKLASLRYPDAKTLVSVGQVVEVVVLECDRSRNIIRFGLTNPRDQRLLREKNVNNINESIDSFLEATRSTS